MTYAGGPPSDWVEVRIGETVRLSAPPGTVFNKGEGADSLVGLLEGPEFKLHVDFGLHSDPLIRNPSGKPRDVESVAVEGRAANLVTEEISPGKTWFIGLHVPEVSRSFLGKTSLSLAGTVQSRDTFDLVRRVLMSVRFR